MSDELDPVTHEDPAYARGWNDANAAAYSDARAVTHEPGDPHRYRIECEVCGQRGVIRLTVDPERDGADPDLTERRRLIEAEHDATHGEAEMCGAECIELGLCDQG